MTYSQDLREKIFAIKSKGRSVSCLNATIAFSSASDKTVDFFTLGPIGKSSTKSLFFHFAAGFTLTPNLFDNFIMLS